jgi:hypothetical protein
LEKAPVTISQKIGQVQPFKLRITLFIRGAIDEVHRREWSQRDGTIGMNDRSIGRFRRQPGPGEIITAHKSVSGMRRTERKAELRILQHSNAEFLMRRFAVRFGHLSQQKPSAIFLVDALAGFGKVTVAVAVEINMVAVHDKPDARPGFQPEHQQAISGCPGLVVRFLTNRARYFRQIRVFDLSQITGCLCGG